MLKIFFRGALSGFLSMVIMVSSLQSVTAQSALSDISLSVPSVIPVMLLTAVGSDALQVTWNWDFIGPGFVPANVTQVNTEISSDGINYGTVQNHAPNDFVADYLTLSAGTYTARVTVVDGANTEYVVGPVQLGTVTTTTGSSGGSGGRTSGGSSGTGTGGTSSTSVTINGLAYPGPAAVVIFTHDGSFQTTISTDANGSFTYFTTQLPAGTAEFNFSARDPQGNLSAPVSFFQTLSNGNPVTVNNVNLPPTLTLSDSVLVLGASLEISGYAYRSGSTSVTLNGPSSVAYVVSVDGNGYWQVVVDTSSLGAGTYDIVAQASSVTGTLSPLSPPETFELITGAPSAPTCGDSNVEAPETCDDGNTVDGDGCSAVCLLEGTGICGDGILDTGEACDDGNDLDGDGCSALCALEGDLPVSAVDPISPNLFTVSDVNLSYTASTTNGVIDYVELYYSRDGAPYVQYIGAFTTGSISMTGLADGTYEVYTIATDSGMFVELPPAAPDATFTIDAQEDFDVIVKPEKMVPPTGNWDIPIELWLYPPGSTTAAYNWQFTTLSDGTYIQDINSPLSGSEFHAVAKGISHLSQRLDFEDFSSMTNKILDFAEGGAVLMKAGDVHSSKDDFVNALDISATVIELYKSEINADLNGDGMVNALDLSVLLGNLYEVGEGIQ